ncbi:MAG: hypothetical protein OEO21_08395 [Candidatus Krumholzibacteria bacterium]|nr:hypothetical protein [Candidatus Krumholzibacteria bacterium]
MSKKVTYAIICSILAALFAVSCGEDTPVGTSSGGPPPEPNVLPEIPVPSSPTDPLPPKSADVDVGLSSELRNFVPAVERMRQMRDDTTRVWTTENRRLKLVCDGGVLTEITSDPAAPDRTYVSKSPRLLHRRYWKRLKQVAMDPGTSYSHQETVTYGNSTTNTVSQGFSQTIGVEVSASVGWGPFSAEVKTSYSQTTTREEVHSVTFSEESSFTDTYSVASDPVKTIVYGLWQLVDVFLIVDENKNPIHLSTTLLNVEIPEIAQLEFLNKDVIYQSVTKFDPAP